MAEITKYKAKRSDSSNSPTVRGAYVRYLFEKRTTRANGKPCTPRRDLTLAFPKLSADPTQCGNYLYLSSHLMQAVSREPQWGGAWPVGGHLPIKDGDTPYVPQPKPGEPLLTAAQLDEMYGWRKGNWIIEVTNYLDPGPKISILKNGRIEELAAQTVNGIESFKSGDYCIVNLCAYTFWNEKSGCNFGFDGVLWVGEGALIGKRSAGAASTDSMFGKLGQVARSPASAMPLPGVTPSAPAAPVPPVPQAPPAPPMPPMPPAPPAPAFPIPH